MIALSITAPASDHRILHDNRVTHDRTLLDHNAASDDRIRALLHKSPCRRRSGSGQVTASSEIYCGGIRIIIFRIDFPELLIQVELRNNIDQLHICFPVGSECSDILPVSVVLIRNEPFALFMTVRNDMLCQSRSCSARKASQVLPSALSS